MTWTLENRKQQQRKNEGAKETQADEEKKNVTGVEGLSTNLLIYEFKKAEK